MPWLVDRPIADEQDLGVGLDADVALQLFFAQRRLGGDNQLILPGRNRWHLEFGVDESIWPRLPLKQLARLSILFGDVNRYLAAWQCDVVRKTPHAVHAATQRDLAAGGVLGPGRDRSFMRLDEQSLGKRSFEFPVAEGDADAQAIRLGLSDGKLGQVLAVRRVLVDVLL